MQKKMNKKEILNMALKDKNYKLNPFIDGNGYECYLKHINDEPIIIGIKKCIKKD